MRTTALIVAAGRGTRLQASRPKPFVTLAGRPILERAARAFAAYPRVDGLVVVAADPGAAQRLLLAVAPRAVVVRGGAERQDSVRLGLAVLEGDGVVLVHDAARPLVEAAVIDAVIEAAERHGAAVPVVRVADTVKRLRPDGTVAATVPREDLALAQTPQGFRIDLLRRAYDRALADGFLGTDDASLVERDGGRVVAVPGSERNVKITTPRDLALAEALLRAEGGGEGRDDGGS